MAGKPVRLPNKRRMARFNLYDLINYTNVSLSLVKRLACVHEATFRRWLAGTSNPPPATVELIRLHAHRRVMPESFTDCYFDGDTLIDDYGHAHTLGDLRLFALYKKTFHEHHAMLRNCDIRQKPRLVEGETEKPLEIAANNGEINAPL